MHDPTQELANAAAAEARRLAQYPERAVTNWSDEARRIQHWTARIARELNISDYRVTYDEGTADGSPAYWDERTKEVRIHRASWASAWSDRERLETVAHETFHAHQWRIWFLFERQRQSLRFDDPIARQARRWRPYACPRASTRQIMGPEDRVGIKAWVSYYGHPFEKDARDFGREFANRAESAGAVW